MAMVTPGDPLGLAGGKFQGRLCPQKAAWALGFGGRILPRETLRNILGIQWAGRRGSGGLGSGLAAGVWVARRRPRRAGGFPKPSLRGTRRLIGTPRGYLCQVET
jgi:hypothetical protein